jgi:hypothetical protein
MAQSRGAAVSGPEEREGGTLILDVSTSVCPAPLPPARFFLTAAADMMQVLAVPFPTGTEPITRSPPFTRNGLATGQHGGQDLGNAEPSSPLLPHGATKIRRSWAASGLAVVLCASTPLGVPGSVPSESAPAAPAPVPPNASRITATVRHVGAQATEGTSTAPAPSDRPLSSLTIDVEVSAPASSELQSFAVPGQRIEALSRETVPVDLVGQRVEATLSLAGDTRGVRWWISDVRRRPLGEEP